MDLIHNYVINKNGTGNEDTLYVKPMEHNNERSYI